VWSLQIGNVHPFGCDGVTIRNTTIFSPRWRGNTDGLDPYVDTNCR
jgi:polygalacturonase